jgi:glutamate-5-semialdehyde dehydrogenase
MSGHSTLELGNRAREASRHLALTPSTARDAALSTWAELLVERTDDLLDANRADLDRAARDGASSTLVDRLCLTEARVAAMARRLSEIVAFPDPVGEVVRGSVRPNGLRVCQVRVPLGVVGVIYEGRPNVTSDAAGLCLKSANAALLRGSSTALSSNRALVGVLREGLAKVDLPEGAVILIEDTSHETAVEFMRLRGVIDCLVPRGGPELVESVLNNATVPCVIDGAGNCHVYVDQSADLDMAVAIVTNAKVQRPSVCNAAESLLVHASVADELLPRVREALEEVELLGDRATRRILPGVKAASEEDFAAEFLDLRLSVAVVGSIDEAIRHIERYGSGHSEAIVTSDVAAANRFAREVDAAAVVVNASTRFVDGGELGLGAEIGISTQKLHARGPMGARELTTTKFVLDGEGQVRS